MNRFIFNDVDLEASHLLNNTSEEEEFNNVESILKIPINIISQFTLITQKPKNAQPATILTSGIVTKEKTNYDGK